MEYERGSLSLSSSTALLLRWRDTTDGRREVGTVTAPSLPWHLISLDRRLRQRIYGGAKDFVTLSPFFLLSIPPLVVATEEARRRLSEDNFFASSRTYISSAM